MNLLEKTIKCPVCERPYKFFPYMYYDQSACPKCRNEAEKNMRMEKLKIIDTSMYPEGKIPWPSKTEKEVFENRLKINEIVVEVNELVGYVNGLINDVKQLRAWVNQREQDDRDMNERAQRG